MTLKRSWLMTAVVALILAGIARTDGPVPVSKPIPAPASVVTGSVTKSAAHSQAVVYAVADLVTPLPGAEAEDKAAPGPDTADLLVQLIPRLVAPGTWQKQGGEGTIDYFPLTLALVVNQTPAVHEQITHFLKMLRKFEPKEFAIEMRMGKGCASPDEAVKLPKLTVFEGQRAHMEFGQETPIVISKGNATPTNKKGLFIDVQTVRIEGDRLGVSLHVRRNCIGKGVEINAIREAKFGEPFKIKLGEPSRTEPVEWFEVVVREASVEKPRPIARTPNLPRDGDEEVAEGERLVPIPVQTLCTPEGVRTQPVIQAVHTEPAQTPLDTPYQPVPEYPPQEHCVPYVPPEGCIRAQDMVTPLSLTSIPVKEAKKDKPSAVVTLKLDEGGELKMHTAGSRVIVEGEALTAHADSMTLEKRGSAILLEGNVVLRYHKGVREGKVSANRLRITLNTGTVDLELETMNTPTTPCVPATSY